MIIIKSLLFEKYSDIIFGFSTKKSPGTVPPFYFNLSLSVGDKADDVKKNRKEFFQALGLEDIAFQKQTHSDIVSYIDKPGVCGESDAMITDKKGIGLAVSVADCTPVFLFDKKQKVVAGIHSGWRGTKQRIVARTLEKLINDFNSSPEDLVAYIGPSISASHYEVGGEFKELFDAKYLQGSDGRLLLDVKAVNYDILREYGIPDNQIQVSRLCTFQMHDLLHSYRRDGQTSGRLLGIIALKNGR